MPEFAQSDEIVALWVVGDFTYGQDVCRSGPVLMILSTFDGLLLSNMQRPPPPMYLPRDVRLLIRRDCADRVVWQSAFAVVVKWRIPPYSHLMRG